MSKETRFAVRLALGSVAFVALMGWLIRVANRDDAAREKAPPELINDALDGVRIYRVYDRMGGYRTMAVGKDGNPVALR